MRTTVKLDPDTEALVRKRMAERGVTFTRAVNDGLREGLGAPPSKSAFRSATANLGVPSVNLDRALQLAGDLEDEDMIRNVRAGK